MRRMIFIEPRAPDFHIFSKFMLPRLGSFILGTMMKQRGWDVEVIVEESQRIDFNEIRSADMVGISTITSTAPRAYAIADRIRKMGIPVIMGGPHVTYLSEEALQHADFVIRGEGEQALMAFIDAWEEGSDYSGVPNLSYERDRKVVHNPLKPFMNHLDDLPYPDFSLFKGEKQLIEDHHIIPVQTSRGCPFDCSFCSVTGMFGKKYRYRSTENIMDELRQYSHLKKFIFFYDDNFTANRKRAKALMEAIIRENLDFKWSTQVRVDVAKDIELVKLMKRAGCHTVFIGFESVNPESLRAMKKNQTLDEIIYAINILQRHKIHIHGMFVYGFDNDNWRTVKETVKFARRARLTSTQFLILTPLPGSEFYNTVVAEDRILIHDWSLYDAHHAIFKPKNLPLSKLQRAQIYSHCKFYSLLELVKKLLRGDWVALGLAYYARRINRKWRKKNKPFLKILDGPEHAGYGNLSAYFNSNIVVDN
jgi:anaerobic magnesium-protoporphyrin IX monomethyl ester cyclase